MEQDSNVNLKWDAHQATLKSVFDTLLDSESLADCTVGAEGQHLKAHKLMLSACSGYFEVLFSQHYGKHVVIVLPGVQFHILKALMEFMYCGEVLVPQDDLDALLQLADFLQVKGLSYGSNELSEKRPTDKRRNKTSMPSFYRTFPESNKPSYTAEILEVSGTSSQSECLQKQDCTKVTRISTPAPKRKKSSLHISTAEPPPEQDLVGSSHTSFHRVPLQRSEIHEKINSALGTFSDPKSRPSLTNPLPAFSEGTLSELTLLRKESISVKPLNPEVRTSVSPTVSEDSSILETFAGLKQENSRGSNEDCVDDVILESDDTQHQTTYNDISVVQSELTHSSFCDGESSTQQRQCHQTGWTNTVPTEQVSAENARFKCQSCDRSYRNYRHLVRHLRYECGVEPQFQCHLCLARYRHKHRLKEHMTRHNR